MRNLILFGVLFVTAFFSLPGFTAIPSKYIDFFAEHIPPTEYVDGLMSREAQLRKFRIEKVLRENGFPEVSMEAVEEVFAAETMIFHSKSSIWLRSQVANPEAHPIAYSDVQIIQSAQEFLNPKPTSKDGQNHCFTCKMRVLTPSGYVPLDQLKVGQDVYSYDVKNKRLIVNKIRLIHSSHDQSFGQIGAAPGLQVVEVTATHPFLIGNSEKYLPIGEITNATLLSILTAPANACEIQLRARGPYLENVGRGRVMTLELEFAPHNFILEGFLVHNKLTKV